MVVIVKKCLSLTLQFKPSILDVFDLHFEFTNSEEMSSVDAIIELDTLSQWLGVQTAAAKACLGKQLHEWSDDAKHLHYLSTKFKKFKEAFQKDPTFYGECHQLLGEISKVEQQLQKLMDQESILEKESYSEILFFKSYLQPLNFVPFLLTIWSTIRVYVLPGLSLLLPILTLIAPYFILTFIFKLPITFANYMTMLQAMVSGTLHNWPQQQPASTSIVSFCKQFGVVAMTFIQGIIQPYWTYKHLKSIDTIVHDEGALVIRFRELYHALEAALKQRGFTFFRCPLPQIRSERDATARIILESNYFKMALKYVGSLEVMVSLASHHELHPVHWITSNHPVFCATDAFDYQVPASNRKTISAEFKTNPHALLTGPNKGGKSTVLRALSVSALLAHTYGCSLGHLTATPFHTIHVCLKPDDLPGSKSRFEREIEFTAHTLESEKPVLVFIDELYHSTNPPDALRSCEIYCDRLWKKPNVISVISTHIFEWVERAPPAIQRLCCPASQKNGVIEFLYTLEKGVCKVSSVDTLLRKNGLLDALIF